MSKAIPAPSLVLAVTASALLLPTALAFAPSSFRARPLGGVSGIQLYDVTTSPSSLNAVDFQHAAELVSSVSSSGIVMSETEPWVQPLASVLDPFLNLFSFAMLCRVVISWYPNTNVNDLPFSLAVWPTEPFLRLIRGVVPPAFGVDITPIVWLGVFTFIHEILLGQQGLLTMKIKYGI